MPMQYALKNKRNKGSIYLIYSYIAYTDFIKFYKLFENVYKYIFVLQLPSVTSCAKV